MLICINYIKHKIKVINSLTVYFFLTNAVRGLLVPNSDNTSTYTAYIQGVGGRVIANPDSSYLFSSFLGLTMIEGLKLLDTSEVTDMSYMFSGC